LQIGNMYRSQKPSKKLQMCQYSATLENLTFDMKITAKCCFIIVSKTKTRKLQNAGFIQFQVNKVQMFVMAIFFLLYLKVCKVKNL